MSPFENEMSCRVLDPKKFDHFRRQDREHKGKKYVAVIAWEEGKGSKDQGYRYHRDIWSESEAKVHCEGKKGTFETIKKIKGGDSMKEEKKLGQEYIFVSPGEIELKEDHLIDIEILKEGSWKHEKAPNGVLILTKDKLKEFVGNFQDKVVGQELPIDIDHKESETAIGWLKKLWITAKNGLDHLWGQIDIVNEDVQKQVKSGELKYFSPSLNFGFEDPETGNKFDVIRSGGLTNWPYLKNMKPAIVNFSEIRPGKETPDRTNGYKLKLVEGQRDKWKKLALTEIKMREQLEGENKTLALELKMSELGSQGRITPAEKFTVRELTKESHNAGLIALRVYEARVNPVVEFGQKSEVLNERQMGNTVTDLIEMAKSDDKEIRERAMAELSERYDRQKQRKGGI